MRRTVIGQRAARTRVLGLLALIGSIGVLSTNCTAAQTPAYYVSQQMGNDSWTGLSATRTAGSTGPFATLTRAQQGMLTSGIKTVYVENGTYTLGAALTFTSSDNGEVWLNYPGHAPVIDGSSKYGVYLNHLGPFTMEGFTFQHMNYQIPETNGNTTDIFLWFTTGITLRWNTFLNCHETCILANQTNNSVIDSNTVNGSSPGNVNGSPSAAYQAIAMTYGSSNNRITHNLIQNCEGGGIGIGSGLNDPAPMNNIIDRNILQNVNTNVVDMGAIYFYDASHSAKGNQITNNIVLNNTGTTSTATRAIYLDDLSSNVLVSGNICKNCGSSGVQIHGGDHNTITNNLFDLSAGSDLVFYQVSMVADDGMATNTFSHNIVYSTNSLPSPLWFMLVNSSDARPIVSNNLYYSSNSAYGPNVSTPFDSKAVYANPGFTNPAKGNYAMPSSSPAYSLIGFKPLATDQGPVSRRKQPPLLWFSLDLPNEGPARSRRQMDNYSATP